MLNVELRVHGGYSAPIYLKSKYLRVFSLKLPLNSHKPHVAARPKLSWVDVDLKSVVLKRRRVKSSSHSLVNVAIVSRIASFFHFIASC